MLRLLVGIIYVALVASLTWPSVKDYEFSHRSAEDDNILAAGCVKHQLPSLLFIGTGHSGSTSLAALMNLHSDLKYGSQKEHYFFGCPDEYADSICPYDVKQYLAGFPVPCETKHTFDASQNYLALASDNLHGQEAANHKSGLSAVEYVHSVVPDANILVMLRDPVDGFFSQGIYNVDDMLSWHFLAQTVQRITTWMSVFPRSRFMFIRAEDAFEDMRVAANQVFNFMGLENMTFSSEQYSRLANSGRRRSHRRASLQERKEFYASPENIKSKDALERLVGMKFDWEGSQ